MAAAGTGIQELMAAEQRASQIVADARAERGQRMRASKDEAESEIAEFRAQMESEFQASSAAAGSSTTDNAALSQQTEREVSELQAAFQANEDRVVQLLADQALQVRLEVPTARKRGFGTDAA